MKLGDLYAQVHARHSEATERRDMATIAECADHYDQMLNDAPEDLTLLFSSGTARMQLGYNGLAIALFEKALRIRELPEIWNNMGTAHKADNRDAEAEFCWRKALELREDADYYNNMATLYINVGNPGPGITWAEKGLQIDPQHARLHWNRSLLLLEAGRWSEGFAEYDWGLLSGDRAIRNYSDPAEAVPFWDGTKGKRVVVYGEQGIGDEIMFASAIPDLMRDCDVVFDCHPRMMHLFRRSFGIPCYGTRKDNVIEWPKREKLDAKISIGSLFKYYRHKGVFPKVPYLKPDQQLVAHYRAKLEALGPGPYVGISWKAGTKQTRADLRSLKIKTFDPIFEQGGTFVSLQYTADAQGKVDRFREESGITVHHWPEVIETGHDEEVRWLGFDYDHTVALCAALDVVIVPNTAVVHVCGAIGKECWTMTPDAPAWRYQLKGEQMPMYGSVRQFRGENAIDRIAAEYKKRLDSGAWTKPAREARRVAH